MPINSKQKGAKAERDVAKFINKALGTNLKRTPQSGGMDFKGDLQDISLDSVLHGFHFEIKDQKAIRPKEWYRQATGDCPSGKIPLVIWKNHTERKVGNLTINDVTWMVEIGLNDFLGIIERELKV